MVFMGNTILCINCGEFNRDSGDDGHCKLDGEFRFFYWGCDDDSMKKKRDVMEKL